MNATSEPRAAWLRYALLATVSVGLLWRVARYLGSFPIWGDEAMLLLNILDRDYAGLTEHLQYAQVAPLFFLWLEKTALVVLGPAEWSVHLFPFLAGLLGLFVFWRTCRTSFTPLVAGLAVAILAVSYYPVRHSAEVKPYAFDLLFAILYAWLALGHLRSPQSYRWLAGLTALAPVAVFTSYPSVFVAGAVSLVLLPNMRSASWPQRGLFLLFNLLLCGSFLFNLTMIGQPTNDLEEAARSRQFLRDYWQDAFPPEAPLEWPLWLMRVHTGNMLAYPVGSNHGGSTLTFLLVLLGSFSLVRAGNRTLLSLCWLPFALNLAAAMLYKYPFGDSARITLHLAPFICILMAHGIGQLASTIQTAHGRLRAELIVYGLLLICGIGGLVRDLRKPYKTEHDREIRQLVLDLRQKIGDEPIWLRHERDKEVLAEFAWYIRTQGMNLDWLPPSEEIPSSMPACWLVRCGVTKLEVENLELRPGWRVVETGVRAVPPENAKMQTMVCRWARVVRE
jgi:hypothetical protein